MTRPSSAAEKRAAWMRTSPASPARSHAPRPSTAQCVRFYAAPRGACPPQSAAVLRAEAPRLPLRTVTGVCTTPMMGTPPRRSAMLTVNCPLRLMNSCLRTGVSAGRPHAAWQGASHNAPSCRPAGRHTSCTGSPAARRTAPPRSPRSRWARAARAAPAALPARAHRVVRVAPTAAPHARRRGCARAQAHAPQMSALASRSARVSGLLSAFCSSSHAPTSLS